MVGAASITSVFLLILLAAGPNSLPAFVSAADECQEPPQPAVVEGLSWSFYKQSCPKLEHIIRRHLKKVFEQDITLAATLLRIHFHDCFVQGCDGSLLLDGTASDPSEKEAAPNLSLRAEAFTVIDELSALVQDECGQVVSCADIAALAARDSVHLSGGPNYGVPLGRRDGTSFATQATTLANLPSPFSNATTILSEFAAKGLDDTDTVALSGGHTIGRSHCAAFVPRLYPTQDPTLNPAFADELKITCPDTNSTNITVLDLRTPNKFDKKYFVDLENHEGLFTSDQDLYSNERTKEIVEAFSVDQDLFFEKFSVAMIKLGQIQVLTGTEGEIRTNCSAKNSDSFPGLQYGAEDGTYDGRDEL
ncbi:hypothetical protein Nepgr_033478 [Nepenthes gracilis]|uniref:Peroxidase n=1 Tax=Nepenthes gracilis TaxID=150966 RepID=A0AAD3Y8P6_NEPGR|nr:hypothetical protein Nepgr_033478 [Nepenthes gracilis]